jgi:hypothetical protein
MEIQFSLSDFNAFVNGINYHKSQIAYMTNTIRILFLSESDTKLFFFHIDPPWRIVYRDGILQNSYNYPYHEDYQDDQQKEEDDFHEWCRITEFMKTEIIKIITVNDTADLIIEWNNGAILNAFINDVESPSYFFYDKLNFKVYEFSYGKCVQDDLKR